MATSMSQICLDHLNCVVLILTCGSSLVVQGCVTAADCNVGQVCCDDDCVDGSSCVGHVCFLNSDCAWGESCCGAPGVCVLGSNCLGQACTPDGTGGGICSGGESCCNRKCINGSVCIGSSCSKDSDCNYRNIEYCCRGTCSYQSGCTNVSITVIIVSSVCGFVIVVLIIFLCIYCRRRVQRADLTTGVTSYGST